MLIWNSIWAAMILAVMGNISHAQLQAGPGAEHPTVLNLSPQPMQLPAERPQADPPEQPEHAPPASTRSRPSVAAGLAHAEFPSRGPMQEAATGRTLSLEELERMALENNPTLRQAAAEVEAAAGRRVQAGLWPNPRVGYTGEEIRGGSARGGQQSFFVEQDIVLGGKLRLGRRVFEQEIRMAELESAEQRLRVVNAVRLGYYQVLTSQKTQEVLRDLERIASETVETSSRLRNIGQADETEVLQAEIEAQQAELDVAREQTRLGHLWTALAAVVGMPDLPLTTLDGGLEENLPDLNEQALVNSLLNESPTVKIAEANVARSEAQLARERRQAVPDLMLRGGLQQNRGLLEPLQKPGGLQGFVEVGVQIPIFNRNQGSVQAATAARERAEQEKARIQLVLRERAAGVIQGYADARARVDRYRTEILPRAQRAYELMLSRWGQMAASYPLVLLAQQTLFRAQTQYVSSLGDLWRNAITLEGYLLVDGLEAPARPGEVDLPVRETNIPTPRGMPGRED